MGDEDCQEGGEGDHREVLHQADPRLPHQQEDHRGSGTHPLQASSQQDCRVYHPLDEEAAEEHCVRHLDQAAGGKEGEKGQLRPRRLRPGAGYHRGRCRDQGDAEDDGLPVYPRPPDDHCWTWRWQPQLPGQPQLETVLKHYPGGVKIMIASFHNLFNLCLKSSRNSIGSSESRKSSRVTFAPNLIDGPGSSRKASSQSLPLASVLSNSDRKKSSSKSEGSNPSRKVSFIDELTGMSAQPNPQFESQLAKQLEIVKEAGEMGEFLQPSSLVSTEL